MNIFVTVGTTPFDILITNLDQAFAEDRSMKVVFQVGPSMVKPENGIAAQFFENVSEEYKRADLIITHAGAGTIFECLQLRKTMLVFPNLERRDKHQSELAEFLERNNYALVHWNPRDDRKAILELIRDAATKKFSDYESRRFFLGPEIISWCR